MYQILPMNTFMAALMLSISLISILSFSQFWMKSFNKDNKKSTKSYMKILNKSMFSLFVSFDPKSSMSILTSEMNWVIMLVLLSVLSLSFWMKPSRITLSKSSMLTYFGEQFEIALKTKKDGSKLLFLSVFFLIVLSNICGLIPNSFTATSHLSTNLFMSVPMWMGFFIFGWFTFTNKMLAHLVPNGTPTMLISFMVLIELISTSIRPFTLSIRLMANMVSGHLLLTLLGNSMVNISFILVIVMVSVQTLLALLETGVCLIQAYVFCMLLTLYSDESDYSK